MRVAWIRPLATAAATFVLVAGLGIGLRPSEFFGDEMEYFAMTYAIATYGDPTLTPAVKEAVQSAFPNRPAGNLVKAVDGSDDALHFWFLSALAAPFALASEAVGLDWRHCFVVLNALALAIAAGVTSLYFGWPGACLLLIGLAASPLLSYVPAAHGEAFSVSLLVVAAVFLSRNRLLPAAGAISVVAAQVTAFTPLAGILLACWAIRLRRERRRPSRTELAALTVCAALLVLQPMWTLWRHQTLNLILKRGYVRPELISVKRIAGMLVDPDVGLLFNWPLGAVLALLTTIGLWRNRELMRKHGTFWLSAVVLTAYVGIVGAQQANYTTSISRYSFWLLPFFLIGSILVYQAERERTPGMSLIAAAIAVVCVAGSAAMFFYTATVTGFVPDLKRRPQAELWYRLFPSVYDPEPQVFADMTLGVQRLGADSYFLRRTRRYPINELSDSHIWAFSNKSCTKLLVFAYAFNSSQVAGRLPWGCEKPLDPVRLLARVRQNRPQPMSDEFVSIPESELDGMTILSFPQPPVAPLNSAPRVDSMVATRRSTLEVTYALRISDPDGWQDIDSVFLAIADSPEGVGCYLVYNQPTHVLAIPKTMQKDSQEASRAILGVTDVLRGEHCRVDPRSISVTADGASLALTIPVSLAPELAAQEVTARSGVTDFARSGDGWTQLAYLFPPPAGGSADLKFVAGPDPGVLKVTVRPGPEFRALSHVWVLIGDRLNPDHACYIGIAPQTRMLYLTRDDPNAGADEMQFGQAGLFENGQCSVDSGKSTMAVSGEGIELTLRVIRKKPFSAPKRVWVGFLDEKGKKRPWHEVGAL